MHRQLLAAIMLKAPEDVRGRFAARLLPTLLPAEGLRVVAEHCNDRKSAAKSMQVRSDSILRAPSLPAYVRCTPK